LPAFTITTNGETEILQIVREFFEWEGVAPKLSLQ